MFTALLTNYTKNKISKKELYVQIKELFHNLIGTRGFLRLKNLKIYPFISLLMDEDLYSEKIIDSEITSILDILNGKKGFEFEMWVGELSKEIDVTEKIWRQYKETHSIGICQLEYIENKLKESAAQCITISDCVFENMLKMMICLPTENNNDLDDFNQLYAEKMDVKYIEEEIEKYIRILTEGRPAHILLLYRRGSFDCICK